MQNLKVLGVKIDNITFKDACETAIKSINQNKKLHIATVNPEITLKAHKDNKYKNILNKTQLNTADGIGILWATHYIQKTKNKNKFLKIVLWFETLAKIFFNPNSIKTPIKERVSGSDLMLEICKNAPSKKINIFLLGAKPHVAKKTKIELLKKYPALNIAPPYSPTKQAIHDPKTINKINQSKANILFVAFGAPKQEIWINKHFDKLKNIKTAIGVGGTFDFISKTKKRAPKLMQKMGIEWIYRLIQEPKRIKRIINAIIIFPLTILKENLKQ